MKKAEYRRRRKNRAVGITVVALIFILLAAVAVLFFRVGTIEVSGTSKYTAEEITAASGIKMGSNLLMLNSSAIESSICSKLTYVSSVTVVKDIPSTVGLVVYESVPTAYISYGGERWLLDGTLRVLEQMTGGSDKAIELRGVEVTAAEAGKTITAAEDGEAALGYASDVLTAMTAAGIAEKTTWLDVANISAISFDYDGRFTVMLGSGENAAYKLKKLMKVVESLDPGDEGEIDVSKDGESRFIPR